MAAPRECGYPAGEIGHDDLGEQSPDKMDHSYDEESPDKVDHPQLVTSLCKDPQKERAEEWDRKEEECERREALLARERALLMEELQVLRLSEQVRQARSGSPPTMGTMGPQQADVHPGQSGSGFGTATSTWTPAGLDPPRRGGYGGAGSGFGGYGGAPTGTPAGFDPPRRGGYGGGLSARGGYVGGHYAQGVKTEPGGETNHQYSETPDPRVFQGIRPKAFSGSKDREEARRFVRRFEHYCSTIKANPAAWGAMFPMYLDGHASDWAMTAPMTELQCDWGRLREEFLRRFGPSVLEASNEYIQAWLGDKLHQVGFSEPLRWMARPPDA